MNLKQKNIIFPLLIVGTFCIVSMIFARIPLSVALLPLVVIIVTVLNLVRKKTIGILFLHGFIATAVCTIALGIIAYASRTNDIALKILQFPF